MTITLDRVTAEMLKELMRKARATDPKKFLTEQIKSLYNEL
jgi:hypothetical protein